MNATRKWTAALVCALVLVTQSAGAAGLFAYVANFETNAVSVIDAASNTVIATLPVGAGPFGVAATPDGRFVYVTNINSNSVSVIETLNNTVIATVPVGPMPFGVAVTPDGRFAYALMGANGVVYAIATATNAVAATAALEAGSPIAIAFSPDGRFAYITNGALNTVSVLDTATNSAAVSVPVGAVPYDVAVTPDGRFAYVVNAGASATDALSVIDTAANRVVASVALEEGSQGVAIHPDGRFVYVAHGLTNSVSVVDVATNTRVASVAVGLNPVRVAVTPDGRFAYVTNQDSASVSVIDTASNTVVASVPVGLLPQGVAFANLAPVDTVAPATTASVAALPNAAGWNNAPVTVTLNATDDKDGSGVKSIAYTVASAAASGAGEIPGATGSFVVSAEGLSTVTYRAVDNAGNKEAAKTLALRIDRVAPASAASASPAPDANGRNTTPVTVSITAADTAGASGVQSITVMRTNGTSTVGETFAGASASVVVSAQGATTVSYQATDNAGNAELARTLVVRIEEAAPAPAFSASVSVTPSVLWPPDRRFDTVYAHVKSANAVGRVRIKSVSVASDESAGRNSPDWIVKGGTVKLRAERDDRGNGRVYTLTYTLVDEAGNTTRAVDTVKVPKYWPYDWWSHVRHYW